MEEGEWHRQVDVPGGTLHICNQQPSFTQVLRAVKRQEHGLFNCIASIVYDYQFVQEIAANFSAYPLIANLRCGLWYAPRPTIATVATCYFKSTDGHSGEWSFSTVRLNLHVALLAARSGGACIVDATRRGKSFPDALTKTVPIWATVLNRAIARLRQRGTSDCNPWDEDLHLPHWISSNERNQLIFRIDRWTEDLLALGADLSGLAEALAKPLRCFWVSQGDGECHIDANAARYTPLILISASVPNMRSRQRLCLDAEDVAALGLAAGDASLTSDSSMCDVDVMFDYIPGAGDDEESWAQGLTPPVMWLHWRNLLQAGPEGIGSLAKQLVKRHKSSNGTTSGGSDAEETWSEVRWVGTTGLGLCIASRAAGLSALDPPCAVVHIGGTHVEGFGPDEHVEVVLQDSLTNEGYLALPGAASSSDKHALLRHLPAAVAFASGSFVAGRRVVIVGDHTKMDVSAAVLLAVLLACFNLKEPDGGGPQLLEWCRPCCLDPVSLVLEPVAQPFSRLVVRQYLAASLAVWCPQVVLSKSLLKQVFNAFYPGRMTKHGSTTIAQTVADDVDN